MIRNIMEHEFDTYVTSSRKTFVVVDFWAEWCGPCKSMAPILDELARSHEAALDVFKVNVDDNSALSNGFGIRSIPTILIFRNGKEIKRLIGSISYNTLVDEISKL